MTGDEIVALSKKHTLFEWSAQGAVDPIPVARAKGVYFWTPEGKRFLDFNSQLMCVNIGHGDERVIKAIQEQAAVLSYANPFMATEPRARLGARLAQLAPGDIDVFFFTNGGAEANENALRMARLHTGRHKVLSAYRSYHGATAAAMVCGPSYRMTRSVSRRTSSTGRGAASPHGWKSGTRTTPQRSTANHSPTRPKPTITSSQIIRMPWRSHSSRTPAR